jgi:hypothetical protein
MANALTSWKEIGQYLGKGVRTVQRWERDAALPVRRPANSSTHAILAFPEELDTWTRTRMKGPGTSLVETLSKEVTAFREEATELRRRLERLENAAVSAVERLPEFSGEPDVRLLRSARENVWQTRRLRHESRQTRVQAIRSRLSLAAAICDCAETRFRWGHTATGERAIQRAGITAQVIRQSLDIPGYVLDDELEELRRTLRQLETRLRKIGEARPGPRKMPQPSHVGRRQPKKLPLSS